MSTEPAMAEPQPVALASAREEPGALVFAIGLRQIRIAGDVDWLREAVALCDGATPPARSPSTWETTMPRM